MMEEIIKRGKIIEKSIEELLPIKEPEGLYNAARHLIKAGGKRLRPIICLLSAEALGCDYRKILPAAIAIESIHNFTLIHDDIMDEDEMRRGVKTVHTLYGIPTAILAGDTLFAEAFKIISLCNVDEKNLIKASKKLAEVCIDICEGQFLDISFESRYRVEEHEYLEMIRKKTAVLIALSSSIPAILFGKEEEIVNALWDFGLNAGMGFQIHDDILDLIGKDKIGKDWGSDLIEGKMTLIVIKAMELGVELKSFRNRNAKVRDIEEDVKRLVESGAIQYAKRRAFEYIERAKKSLSILEDSYAKSLLTWLADYLISREY